MSDADVWECIGCGREFLDKGGNGLCKDCNERMSEKLRSESVSKKLRDAEETIKGAIGELNSYLDGTYKDDLLSSKLGLAEMFESLSNMTELMCRVREEGSTPKHVSLVSAQVIKTYMLGLMAMVQGIRHGLDETEKRLDELYEEHKKKLEDGCTTYNTVHNPVP